MRDLEKITSGFSAMLQKNIDAQRQNWYGYFNSSGAMGSNFYDSLYNYIRMAFFSSALANNKTVQIHSSYKKRSSVKTICDVLETMGAKVIYKETGVEDQFVYSFDNAVVCFNNVNGDDLIFNIISFDDSLLKKIEEQIE